MLATSSEPPAPIASTVNVTSSPSSDTALKQAMKAIASNVRAGCPALRMSAVSCS